jgi:hypothetical protein
MNKINNNIKNERINLLLNCYEDVAEKTANQLSVEVNKLKIFYGLWIISTISTIIRIIEDERYSSIVEPLNNDIKNYQDAYYYVRTLDDAETYYRRKHEKNEDLEINIELQSTINWHIDLIIEYIINKNKKIITNYNKSKIKESILKCVSCDLFNFQYSEIINKNQKYDLQSVGGDISTNIYRFVNKRDARIYQHGLQQFLFMEYHPHDVYAQNNFIIVYYLKWMYSNNDSKSYPKAEFKINYKIIQKIIIIYANLKKNRLFFDLKKSITLIDYDIPEGQYPWSIREEIKILRDSIISSLQIKELSKYDYYFKQRHNICRKLKEKLDNNNIAIVNSYHDRRLNDTIYVIPYISTAIYEIALSGAKFVIYLDPNLTTSKITNTGLRFLEESGLTLLIVKTKNELVNKILWIDNDNHCNIFRKIRNKLIKMTFM